MLLLKRTSKILVCLLFVLAIAGCGNVNFTQLSIIAETNDDVYETGYATGNSNYIILYEGGATNLVLMSEPSKADQEKVICQSNNKDVAKVDGRKIIAVSEGGTKVFCEVTNDDDTVVTSNYIDVIVWGE